MVGQAYTHINILQPGLQLLTTLYLDEFTAKNRAFYINVDHVLKCLAEQEDTNGDMQITVEDLGPKVRAQCIYTCIRQC